MCVWGGGGVLVVSPGLTHRPIATLENNVSILRSTNNGTGSINNGTLIGLSQAN